MPRNLYYIRGYNLKTPIFQDVTIGSIMDRLQPAFDAGMPAPSAKEQQQKCLGFIDNSYVFAVGLL